MQPYPQRALPNTCILRFRHVAYTSPLYLRLEIFMVALVTSWAVVVGGESADRYPVPHFLANESQSPVRNRVPGITVNSPFYSQVCLSSSPKSCGRGCLFLGIVGVDNHIISRWVGTIHYPCCSGWRFTNAVVHTTQACEIHQGYYPLGRKYNTPDQQCWLRCTRFFFRGAVHVMRRSPGEVRE